MWDFVRSALGEANRFELALALVFFFTVVLYSWAPRIGEAVGGLFDEDEL